MARRHKTKYLMISAVAERFEIHPQTLRLYEREGLIAPKRSDGNTRLYDDETLRRLEIVLTLTREMGVNLAGVEVVLNMREQLDRLRDEMDRALELVRRQAAERRGGVQPHHALVKFEGGPLVRIDED
jgi:MerR family transcriptional regulator, heat shock protein HspR